jgi:hypothetical protein
MARLRRALAPSEHVRRLRPGRSHVGARFRFRVNRAVPLEQPFGSSLSSIPVVRSSTRETLATRRKGERVVPAVYRRRSAQMHGTALLARPLLVQGCGSR